MISILCGHADDIMQAKDAYYVQCSDGAGDVCETCFTDVPAIHSGEEEPNPFRVMESSYWFEGTMEELKNLLNHQK
jgi:hypothetical protein